MAKWMNQLLFMGTTVFAYYSYADAVTVSQVNTISHLKKNNYTLSVKDEQNNKVMTVKLRQYNPELYELAYKVFSMNNKIKESYLLAEAAVRQQPKNLIWRRRLAQVAIWNNQYQTALDQWLYIAQQTKNNDDIESGKKIAKKIYNYAALSDLLWLQISPQAEQKDRWLEYINTVQTLGKPEIAIAKLQTISKINSDPFFKEQLAVLYQSQGDIKKEQEVINRIRHRSSVIALKNAAILINQHRVKEAFQVLHIARKYASLKDKPFWETYGQLAWTLDQRAPAAHAYRVLIHQGYADLESYQRLITLQFDKNPEEALTTAKMAMAKFKTNSELPLDVLGLQQKLGRWHEMHAVMNAMSHNISNQLNYSPYFWTLKAERWQYTNQETKALAMYLQGIKTLPDSVELQRDYLWFLINTDRTSLLPNMLFHVRSSIPTTSELWGASAFAYYQLHQPIAMNQILSLYSQQLQNNLNDPYWQLDLADIYDQTDPNMGTDFTHRGDELRRYTWPIYLQLLMKQGKAPYYDQLLHYMKLSQQEAAGDPTANVVAILMTHAMNPEAEELIMNWAIDQNNFELAEAIYTNYLSLNFKPSSTGLLRLALHREDRHLMRKILADKPNQLQHRDRVDAANRINALPLAQSLAMQGLREHPNDYQMYNLFTEVMLKSSPHLDVKEEFFQYGSLQGMRTYLAGTYFVTPGMSITPYAQDWFVHVNNTTELSTSSSQDQLLGLKSKALTEHGYILLDLARRKSLKTFPTALLTTEYLLSHDLNSRLKLGYQQLADDTALLYVSGYVDYVTLKLDYTLTQRDLLTLELAQKFFYTQDHISLANGNMEELGFEHYFWRAYPDLSLRFYARGNQYRDKTSTLSGAILSLIPAAQGNNIDLAFPPSNTEFGVTAQMGTNYVDDYTHRWRPFAAVTLLRNSDAGVGEIVDVGIAGSVLGRDHLAIYYNWGKNQGPGVQKEVLTGFSYRYYF